jgi:hypothetical protein
VESTPSAVCASCGETLSEAEVAFGARLCPACSSQRAESTRTRIPASDESDVTLLEQEILERVQRELAVDSTAVVTPGASLFDPSGATLSSEAAAPGLILIDGMGVLVPLPSDGVDAAGDEGDTAQIEAPEPSPDTGRIE